MLLNFKSIKYKKIKKKLVRDRWPQLNKETKNL